MTGHMNRISRRMILAFTVLLAAVSVARGQAYIGYVYPAGGQIGTTFQVLLGGQGFEGISNIFVSGKGVTARLVEYNKRMNNQETALINEQLRELRNPPNKQPVDPKYTNLIARIEKLLRDNVETPASASIANLVIAEITIASNVPPGKREIRVGTKTTLSNPMVFMLGEFPEYAGPAVPPSRLITLGKESASLRRKVRGTNAPPVDEMMSMMMNAQGPSALPSDLDDDVVKIQLPATVNGQITSGTVDRYRFFARKGEHLVLSAQARELIPYMADAVPGWFQAVIALWDSKGNEVAYDDDFRFKPDPVVFYEVPEDGEYMFAIYDSIYRGREDFVYRVSIGEQPFITSIFPIGAPAGTTPDIAIKGINLTETHAAPPPKDAAPGVYTVSTRGKGGYFSNRAPFAFDSLPEITEEEPNNTAKKAQSVKLPVIINGRMDKPGDVDIFKFEGHAGDQVVAEVSARRLDSPLDSVVKLTDANDQCLAINDDNEDLATGLNTHHADSYMRATLPSNGTYYVHISDTEHNGGEEYAYRLRVSAPQIDFALRVVPSYMIIRSNSPANPKIYIIRKDGYTGPIKITLKDPPPGFEMPPVTMIGTQASTYVTIKANFLETTNPVPLTIIGTATNQTEKVVREAMPAEDRMQAFLWRHLVPAQELLAMVIPPPPKAEPVKPAVKPATPAPAVPPKSEPAKPVTVAPPKSAPAKPAATTAVKKSKP